MSNTAEHDQTVDVLDGLVRQAAAESEAIEAELKHLQIRLISLRDEHRVLKSVLARHRAQREDQGAGQPRIPQLDELLADTEAPGDDGPELQGPRTDVVDRVLRWLTRDGSPVGPGDVQSYMADHGRPEKRDHISAAMAYLNTKGRARRVGHAQWMPADPTNAEDPVATGSSGSVPTTSEGRADGTEPNGVLDHDQATNQVDRDHHLGAPIRG